MNDEQIINYIKNDPQLLNAFKSKSVDEQNSILKEFTSKDQNSKKQLYTPIEREEENRPVMQAGVVGLGVDVPKTVEEFGMAGVEAINSLAYGLPEFALNKAGYEIPEPTTLIGKTLKAGGTAAGIAASPITKGISKLVTMVIPRSLSATSTFLKIAKPGVEGAAIGEAYTPKEEFFDFGERGMNALTGATVGSLIGTIGKSFDAFKKWKAKTSAKPELEIISEKEAKIKTKVSDALRRSNEALSVLSNEAKKSTENLIKALESNTLQQADIEARTIQKTMRNAIGNISKDYGRELDVIEPRLIKSKGSPITKEEMSNILNKTINETRSYNADSGNAYNEIIKLADKYKLGKVEYGQDGLPIIKYTAEELEPIDFRQAIDDIRGAANKISSASKGIKTRDTVDDLAANILRKNWYDYLGQYDDGLKELNANYSQTLKEIKPMMDLVKPYGVDTQIGSLSRAINNVALGKAIPNDLRLLSKIEDGVNMYRGVGKQTSTSMNIGSQIPKQIDLLEKRMSNLERKNRLKKIKLSKIAEEKLTKLGLEREAVKQIARNEKISHIINGAAGLTGFGVIASYAIKRYSTGKLLSALNTATGSRSTAGE